MAIEYLGLSEINGPLVVLEGVKKSHLTRRSWNSTWRTALKRSAVSWKIYEDKAVIQGF